MSGQIWYQGEFMTESQLGYDGVSLDRGLQYGDGFFTTLLLFNGKAVNWRNHLKRIEESVDRLKFIGFDRLALVKDFESFLGSIPKKKLQVIKILVTRGFGGRGYQPSSSHVSATWLFHAMAYPEGGVSLESCLPEQLKAEEHAPPAWQIFPQKLTLSEVYYGKQPLLAGLKHLNRLENVLARQALTGTGFDEAVMLDSDGVCVSGTQANLVWIKDNTLYTPDLSRAGVAGTTLPVVLQLAEGLGYQVQVGRYQTTQLEEADEILLTNAVRGVMPVSLFSAFDVQRNLSSDKTAELAYHWMKASLADLEQD